MPAPAPHASSTAAGTCPLTARACAELAKSLRGTLVHLDDAQFALLAEACRLHSDGLTVGRPTVQACWDADRLDLGRVGNQPLPQRLCTDAARGLLAWAHARAVSGHVPAAVLDAWGAGAGIA